MQKYNFFLIRKQNPLIKNVKSLRMSIHSFTSLSKKCDHTEWKRNEGIEV